MRCLSSLKASWWRTSHDQATPFCVSSHNGALTAERFCTNFPRYVIMPIKVANSSLLFGSGMSTIASTRSGLGSRPFDEKI